MLRYLKAFGKAVVTVAGVLLVMTAVVAAIVILVQKSIVLFFALVLIGLLYGLTRLYLND